MAYGLFCAYGKVTALLIRFCRKMSIEIEPTYLWTQLSSKGRELLEGSFTKIQNCFLRIICATSIPSKVAEDEMKVLKPFICLISFLMNLWSCSIILFIYLTCKISISQNHLFIISRQFMFSTSSKIGCAFV
jgi:hypothetical protein